MAITKNGSAWEIEKTLILTILVFIGMGWLAFAFMAAKTRQIKWGIIAFCFILPSIVMVATVPRNDEDAGALFNIAVSGLFIFWFVGIVYFFVARREYLLRVEALESKEDYENDLMRRKINREYRKTAPGGTALETSSIDSILPRQNTPAKTNTAPVSTPTTASSVDLNNADTDELAGLPGMNSILGKRAVELRETQGAFTSLEDFGEKLGLQPHIIEKIRPQAVINAVETEMKTKPNSASGRTIDY